MGFKIALSVRHIAGWTFKIDCERDADILGIKLIIYEDQHIPIESQRLVFGGREMEDQDKLSDFGIIDGDQLFLVESKPAQSQPRQQEILATSHVEPIEIRSNYIDIEPQLNHSINLNKVESFNISGSNNYNYLDSDSQNENESKIRSVTRLSFWIRLYLVLGLCASIFCALRFCIFSLLPLLCYVFGIVGTRRLSKCLLVVPLILTLIIGVGGTVIDVLTFRPNWQHYTLTAIAILHIFICYKISKLICRISKLNATEYRQCRVRISSRGCC